MEGNRRAFSKKQFSPQFKKKGGNKKGKWHNSSHELSSGYSQSSDTVYRILCHSKKIGSVIGKGGNIIRALRENTQAKITVADSVPGSDERVIIIYSPSTKIANDNGPDDSDNDLANEKEDDLMDPHCAAQDALLKVHERIVEEDVVGGTENGEENHNLVTARLLVPNHMVGCLLGKKGDVIQRLRSETGASIRVLPAEHLPSCAMSTDELVQISGKPAVAKRALYEVSTLLHQNPRKDKPPLDVPMPYLNQSYYPPGPPLPNMPPPGNPIWSQRNSNPHRMPSLPWMGEYEDQRSGFGTGGFNGGPPAHTREAPSEFFMKILCSAAKIGGVIGKGGFNVRQLQQETGASIHVEDVSAESDERVIRVSSFEAVWKPRSQTIEAILLLQIKTSEYSEEGIVTTRLLVPSSKVGCILGQGGQVINEMRRRTRADIRVNSKEDKPKCASEDEELVQISGSFGIARDALGEIASRLRTRCLRDANAAAEPAPVGPVARFGAAGHVPAVRPPPSASIGAGSSVGYELLKGGAHDYDPPSYAVPPSAPRYQNINSSMEKKIPSNLMDYSLGRGTNINEIGGTRLKLQDPLPGSSERVVEIHGPSDHYNASQSTLHPFIATAGQTNNPQQSSYADYNTQQGTYTNNISQSPYQNYNPHQVPYQTLSSQQTPYQSINAQGSYQY